jgi:NAD(P)-dependent dehydrogenase (short-subunit alcohol dehydrogenase family)
VRSIGVEQYSCAHSSAPASQHPVDRVGRPSDVAAMAAYLLDATASSPARISLWMAG